MAYGRRRKFRKRRFIRRTGRKRGATRSFIKRTVRRMAEIKYCPLTASGAFDAFVGYTQYLLPAINQGTDKNQRIANNIRLKYFQFRGVLNVYAGVLPPTFVWLRIIIGYPLVTPTNGISAPLVTQDVLDTLNFNSTIKNRVFRPLYDKTFSLSVDGVGAQSTNLVCTKFIKLKRKFIRNVNYNLSTTTEIREPPARLYIYVQSTAAANTASVFIDWYTRISYIDL